MSIQSKSFLIAILLLISVSLNAYANPQGANVVAGSATLTTTPNTLTINTASNKTIINYDSFSIAANESTIINQPNASSSVLNRVIGVDPSDIYGTLSSNGQLFLVNPNGILFGPNSHVNAPAILASTLDISNNDFLNDNYNFIKNGGSASIINQGRLAASPGGYIALLSQAINNQGVIVAPLGSVALASGDKLTLALDSQSQISVAVDDAVKNEVLGPNGQQINSAIQNGGTIKANGGKVLLTAKVLNDVFDNAVNNSGVIKAGSIQDHKGVVELVASGAPIVNTGALISNAMTLTSDSDISSFGVLESSSLLERGNTFKVGGTFEPGYADIKNADNAITYSSNTNVSGLITDAANIVVDPSVTLTETADTSFEAGGAFTMDPTSSIAGGGYNLSLSALNASSLGNISNVNLLTLSLISGSSPVTFTSSSSSTFSVNTVKTDNLSLLSRSIGTGTSINPIMIYSDSNTSGGLQYIPTSGLGLYYQVANNIDASETSSWNSGAGFVPIGNNSTPFTGNFNGDGYTIADLFINLPSMNQVGLFGVTSGSIISNIGLTNVNVTGQNYVGGLAGENGSAATISNSYMTGSVTGSSWVGALVGENTSSTISDSYTTGSVTASSSYVGGLAGDNNSSSASISNDYATGSVSGNYDVGGLVGYNGTNAAISNSYATGTVTGGDYTGGLVGENTYSSTTSNSYATGTVTGSSWVGGLAGENTSSTISNSYATGSVTGSSSYVGGLAGDNNSSSTISNSYATGSATGSIEVGGLIGHDSGGNTITNNWWYNSQTYGIGNNATAQSTGNWQKASGASDFYSSSFTVYTGSTPWNFTSVWYSPSGTYPSLR